MSSAQAILEAATRLMAQRGFDGTSLKAIADEVGIRKASLLYHFPSKNALRRRVLQGVFSHWNEALPRLLEAATRRGVERFDALIGELCGFFSEDLDRARLLLRETLDRPTDMRAMMLTAVRPWVRLVADEVERGQGAGTIHPDVDAEPYVLGVIHLVVSGLATIGEMGAVLPGADPAAVHERYIREVVRLARTALFTDPHPGDDPAGGPP